MKENGTEISTNFYRVHNYNFKRERERDRLYKRIGWKDWQKTIKF